MELNPPESPPLAKGGWGGLESITSTPILRYSITPYSCSVIPVRDISLSLDEQITFPGGSGFPLFQYSIIPPFPPLLLQYSNTPVLHYSIFLLCVPCDLCERKSPWCQGQRGTRRTSRKALRLPTSDPFTDSLIYCSPAACSSAYSGRSFLISFLISLRMFV